MSKKARRSWITIVSIAIITAVLGAFIPGIILDNDVKEYFPSEHPSYKRMKSLDDTYGSQIFLVVSITNPNGTIVNKGAIDRIRGLTTQFEGVDGVESVKSMTKFDYLVGGEGGMSSEQLIPDSFSGTPEELTALEGRIADWSAIYDRVLVSDDRSSSEILLTINKSLTAPQLTALYRSVRGIVDKCRGDGFEYRIAGDPVLSQMAQDYMRSDLVRLIPAVIIVVLLCLYFSFQTLAGTLLPLITVLISTIWTVGLMAITGTHFTVVSSCLPVLLIAVGSAYGIHVLNHYYEELSHEYGDRPITQEEHYDLIYGAAKGIRKAVLLAGITTVIGFASTFTSPIVPLKSFAIFSTVGVTISLVLALVFIPALLSLRPIPADGRLVKQISHRKTNAAESKSPRVRAAVRLNEFTTRRSVTLAVLVAAVVGVAIWGTSRINIESALLSYFPKECQLRRDVEYIDQRFAGSNLMSLVVKGKEKGDLTDPRILDAMDKLSVYLAERHPEIGKTVSYSDFIKRMNKVMHVPGSSEAASGPVAASGGSGDTGDSFFSGADSSSFFDSAETEAPSSTASESAPVAPTAPTYAGMNDTLTTAQALDLFRKAFVAAGPNPSVEKMLKELEKSVNYRGADYDEIPVDPGKYSVSDVGELKNLVSQYLILYSGSLNEYSNDPLQPSEARISVQLRTHETGKIDAVIRDAQAFAARNFPEGYTIEASGIAEMEVALTSMITTSQVSSLVLSLLGVFIVLAIAFHSPVAGILGSITLGIAILINFGIMGLLGINLDMVTSLISSIAIGIGIDYTIHFLSNYHHERLQSDDLAKVTLNTYLVSGKAILVNALSVAFGFLVLAFSKFVVLRYIGILVAVCMITSSAAAMVVLPVMLNVFKPKFISRNDEAAQKA
jgi:uncharacterized protein